MILHSILLAAETETQSIFGSLLPMILIMGGMFFFMSRSNKKREKEAQQLRDSLEVGDEIVTIGGIVARVAKLEEETLLIESGPDRSKLRIQRAAVGSNTTAIERVEEEKAKKQANAAKEKESKKKK